MPFNPKKVAAMARGKGIKAKDFAAYIYPDRSGNTSYADVEKNDNPKVRTVELMADLLRCPIDELFDRAQKFTPSLGSAGTITAEGDAKSTAPKGSATIDPRLIDILQARDRQLEKSQEQVSKAQEQVSRSQEQVDKALEQVSKAQTQLDKSQEQLDRLIALLEASRKLNQN